MRFAVFSFSALVIIAATERLLAEQPPSYAKQVKPFLAKYCLECHNAEDAKGGLVMDSVHNLQKGGDHGPVIVPGKPDKSRLVLLPERKAKPPMPPKKAKQPKPAEVAILREWVAAGAKDDSATIKVQIPDIKPRVRTQPPITALAYSPDGKLLAVGAHKTVLFIDPATGDVMGRLAPHPGKVTALSFSRDGRRLAVASSRPATAGEVFLYWVGERGCVSPPSLGAVTQPRSPAGPKPERVLAAHKDAILDMAFSPDGRVLATTGYDRLIKLWDVASGKELRTLKDHSDAVYSLAFSPDGLLLGSAAADRAVKVWDVAHGTRLYTLGEATDWLYAIAWSPDGRHLAAAGVDKSIRVWAVSRAGGKIVHSIFAHDGPVTRLHYAADGKTLYSVGEDNIVKAWNTATMIERKVYPRQPEAVLAMAVRETETPTRRASEGPSPAHRLNTVPPDHKQLALGRYDGTVVLLDEATGKVQSEPLPIKPKPPVLAKLSPPAGQRGQTIRITFDGKHLDTASEVVSTYPGVRAKLVKEGKSAHSVQAEVTLPPDAPAGIVKLGIRTAVGKSNELPFIVDLFPTVAEVEPNDSPKTGQKVSLPVSVVGAITQAGSVDYYRFEAQAGQQIGVEIVTSAIGSKLQPVLQLIDDRGDIVAESTSGVLGYACDRAGVYALGVRDRDYRGSPDMHYRLHMGNIPVITAVFPLGLQRGTDAEISIQGVNLGPIKTVRVKAAAHADVGSRLPVTVQTPNGKPLGGASVIVGEFPEVVSSSHPAAARTAWSEFGAPSARHATLRPPRSMPVPGTGNGRMGHHGVVETWRFAATKGQRLIVEVNARRLGSPLDSYLEILDAAGKPVPRATLRCVAKTYVNLRDNDSSATGIRIESWNELAMNDYVWVGNELLRIRELPKNPDDDCHFFGIGKQRITYLDTTPAFIPQGVPMYKVTVHPPGSTFPPNGFPVIHLDYRNDDGGPAYGKDSRIFFDAPADGEYQVRIGDSRGQGGSNYAYRLTVRPPRPSFKVHFSPTAPKVWRGGAVPIAVSADRIDGFNGTIHLRLENLPAGFNAPETTIPAGENTTAFALSAEARSVERGVLGAPRSALNDPRSTAPLKLVAWADIDGQQVSRQVKGGLAKIVDPGDLVITTEQYEATVKPGQQVQLTARIERRNGFNGRVPLEVRGLPHGVRVLNIGLNGILITEKESSRTFVIYAEPWVQATTHPFVVLAKNEGKNTEYAAKSVLLRVQPLPQRTD